MALIPEKFLKTDYWHLAVQDKLPFLRNGHTTIRSHPMTYAHWPYFYGTFFETFINENYRIDGLTNVRHIIDAGANIGIPALYFSLTYPGAHIDCFEPNPEALPYLRQNTVGFKNLIVHPYALGAEEDTVDFYVDSTTEASSMAGTVNILGAKKRTARTITVPMHKLSNSINGTIDILKIDIEGAEKDVLADLVATGKLEHVRNILMELHYDPRSLPESPVRIFELLERNGFFFYIRQGAVVTSPQRASHAYMLFAFRI